MSTTNSEIDAICQALRQGNELDPPTRERYAATIERVFQDLACDAENQQDRIDDKDQELLSLRNSEKISKSFERAILVLGGIGGIVLVFAMLYLLGLRG